MQSKIKKSKTSLCHKYFKSKIKTAIKAAKANDANIQLTPTKMEEQSTTITDSSRNQKVRQTLPSKVNPSTEIALRPRSQSYTQKTKIVLEPPIPEADGEEEEGAEVKLGDNATSTRMSFTKKPPSRSNSITGVKAKIIEVRGYDNGGFDVNGGAVPNFQRGYADSTRSSAHESVQSLQVQREQYCCFSRWSPFEKRLATSVGILAGVIIGLVIAVGLLARNGKLDETFVWKP